MTPKTKEFLVTGVGRSGTKYMSELFTNLGYPIGHERMGEYGKSCWQTAAHPEVCCKFNHIINVVRNPVHIVRSFFSYWPAKQKEMLVNFRKKFISIERESDILTQAVQIFVGWNRLITSLNPDLTIKLENAHETIPKYLKENGYKIPDQITYPRKDVNSKPKRYGGENKKLTLKKIEHQISEELFLEFNKELMSYEKLN